MDTIFRFDTELYSDSVECLNLDDRSLISVGTYQLDETSDSKNQQRNGLLYLFEYSSSGIKMKSKVETKGILDMKWNNQLRQLALSQSQGAFQIYSDEAVLLHNYAHSDDSVIFLSLDWGSQNEIYSSTNKGSIIKFLVDYLKVDLEIKAHDYEVWSVCTDKFTPHVIYSGADDCVLKIWDLRDPIKPSGLMKHHSMGVCSIQCHPNNENLLTTGSYDEFMYHFDKRNIKSPLSKVKVGGGVWRIKWHPNGDLILVAAMHNGFHVYDYNNSEYHIHYDEHKSLAYGADWIYLNNNKNLAATSSFYDHEFRVWSVD